ncbi:DUF7344 domain-containing protein [Halorussus caseinilyticus]|uniref:DUF7344 domain-containing protein n=1 Tax=Halorussus caseinilyticus TaxID=3034025 RepID=UPI0023E8A730|nr:hypothetical protein [Halorussus sp. DT72]
MSRSRSYRSRFDANVSLGRSLDAVLDALASRRRREALSVLRTREGSVSESDLVSHVVARRADKPLLDVTREEHRQTWTRFHHVHLPKLADAGLIRRSDGRVSAASSPVLDRPEFDALVRRDDGETDDESDDRDAILSALADGRRRTVLSVLRETGRLELPTLARRVAAREDDAPGGPSDERVESVLAGLRHAHAPKLAAAGLVEYDDARGTISYEGHPAFDPRWLLRARDE